VLKDSHGIPAPRIDYRIGDNSARMLKQRHRPREGGPCRKGAEPMQKTPSLWASRTPPKPDAFACQLGLCRNRLIVA
jgi:hypothetical protein